MNKSDFFDDFGDFSDIIAFEKHGGQNPGGGGGHEQSAAATTAIYYEWSKPELRWMKTREDDPDPSPGLPPGKFDGQIIEVEL